MSARSVTSASNAHRRWLCPGSEAAESECAEETSEFADEGTLLHDYACAPKLPRGHLTSDQRSLLDRADQGRNEVLAMVIQSFDIPATGPGSEMIEYTAKRLNLTDAQGNFLLDGEIDHVFCWPALRVALVIDYKMGFIDVTPAAQNVQLECYAPMWADYLGCEQIAVAIVQPRSKEKFTIAQYDAEGIKAAREDIAAILAESRKPDAPRFAGEQQCRYCRAKVFCEEYRQRFSAVAIKPDLKTIEALPADQLARLFHAVRTAGQISEQVKDEVRRRVELKAPGFEDWGLKPGRRLRKVNDPVAAYSRFADKFADNPKFTPEGFNACLDASVPKLEELLVSLGAKKSHAGRMVSEILGELLEWKETAASPQPPMNAETFGEKR